MTYKQLMEYIAAGRNKTDRPFANNTRVRIEGSDIVVRLHDTDIVRISEDDTVTLNSGGWKTVTTKERMNRFLSKHAISQEKGVWYVWKCPDWDDRIPYADGMSIAADGTIVGAADSKAVLDSLLLGKQISKYAKAFSKAFADGRVSAPSAGDCFYCMMRTEDGKSLGEAAGNTDHLLSHMTEGHFVPSLLVNAMESTSVAPMLQWYVYGIWQGDDVEVFGSIVGNDVARIIRRYLRKELGIAG